MTRESTPSFPSCINRQRHRRGRALLTGCLAVGAVSGVKASFPAVRQLVASSLVTGKTPPGTVAERMARLKPLDLEAAALQHRG